MTSLYGPIVSAADVRDAVRDTIRTWAAAYTAEAGRQHGVTLPPIRYWGAPLDLAAYTDDTLPACLVVAPGLSGDPERRADGFDAAWAVGVGVLVAHLQRDEALDLAALYTAAVRTLLVQQGGLGGFAVETTWTDEEIAPAGFERDRWIAGGKIMGDVHLERVLLRPGGPAAPPADPAAPLPGVPVSSAAPVVTRKP